MPTPEELARQNIDKQLEACGWIIQSRRSLNLYAGRGIAVREFPLDTGEADYLLFVDRKAVGVVEAKHEGTTLIQDKKAGIVGRWGLQALAPGEKPKGSNLGFGVVAAPDRIVEVGEDANNSYMRLRGENLSIPGRPSASNQSYVRYRIHASWSLEPAGANSASEYEAMLRGLSEPEPAVMIDGK